MPEPQLNTIELATVSAINNHTECPAKSNKRKIIRCSLACITIVGLIGGIIAYFLTQRPDGCKPIANKLVIDRNDAVTCYRSFSYSYKESKKIIDILHKYTQISSTVNFLKENPDPHFTKKIDVLKDLEEFKKESFESDFDFHQSLSVYFLSLEEGHTVYQSPGFNTFKFQLSFGLLPFHQDGELKLQVMDYNLNYNLKKEWLRRGVDMVLLKADFVISIEGKPAMKYIREFADKFVGISRDPHFRTALSLAHSVLFFPDVLTVPGLFAQPMLIPDRSNLTFVFKKNGKLTIPYLSNNPGQFQNSNEFYDFYIKKNFLSMANPSVKLFKKTNNLRKNNLIFSGIFFKIYRVKDAAILAFFAFPGDETKMNAWKMELNQVFSSLEHANLPKLILDLSNNTGGMVQAGIQFLEILFNQARTNTFKSYITNNHPYISDFNEKFKKGSKNNIFEDNHSISLYKQVSRYIDLYLNNHSSVISLDLDWSDKKSISTFFKYDKFLSSVKFGVISNSICASSCALVANWIQENTKIPTFHVGNLIPDPAPIGSCIGGTLLNIVSPNADLLQFELTSLRPTIRTLFSIPFVGFKSFSKPNQNLDFTWLPAQKKKNVTLEHHFNPEPIWAQVVDMIK